jgi:hypothetical protein
MWFIGCITKYTHCVTILALSFCYCRCIFNPWMMHFWWPLTNCLNRAHRTSKNLQNQMWSKSDEELSSSETTKHKNAFCLMISKAFIFTEKVYRAYNACFIFPCYFCSKHVSPRQTLKEFRHTFRNACGSSSKVSIIFVRFRPKLGCVD